MPPSQTLGCVVIGRNEGQRLRRCLESLAGGDSPIVYVDSGSTDGSQALAARMGCILVDLDLSLPFTAARARNAGFARLALELPGVEQVQFIDGDSALEPGWLAAGRAKLEDDPQLGAVFGLQRERTPEKSVFHRLMHIEWQTPPGPQKACAGNAMMRAAAFRSAGGFREDLIAGEEPELCIRMRRAGFRIECIAVPMAIHDAGDLRLRNWWNRVRRAGHAFAEGAHLHGAPPECHWVGETRRALRWGLAVPAIALAGLPFCGPWSLLILLGYPVSAWRSYRFARRRGTARRDASITALFFTVGKLAEARGVLSFHWARLRGRRKGLIDYKSGEGEAVAQDARSG
jgi:GT2 family glycosyltransferase